MSHQNETIDNRIKSYIVSVNGEGLTIDLKCVDSSDLGVLDALIEKVKQQCISNDNQKQQ